MPGRVLTSKYLFLFILLFPASLIAQPEERGIQYRETRGRSIQPQYQRSLQALSLPFADDFAYPGPYPNSKKWIETYTFVNPNMAKDPPSIGVVTFDGLDQNGAPYGGGYGGSDTLTSQEINLEGRPSVYISFFVQPKGFGVKPREQDSLVLEVKSESGNWYTIIALPGLNDSYTTGSDPPPFEFYSELLADSLYHSDFQFRFRNKSTNNGQQELWHLDYILVTENPPNSSFIDLALSKPPDRILNPYSAMPFEHFKNNEEQELRKSLNVSLYNNSNFVLSSTQNRFSFILSEGQEVLYENVLLRKTGNIDQTDVFPGDTTYTRDLDSFELESLLELNPQNKSFQITTEYFLEVNNSDDNNEENDQANVATIFDNYFAYDDGTAESAVFARNGDNGQAEVVVEYHANVPDSIKGVQMQLPRVGTGAENLIFDILIWVGELDTDPDFVQRSLNPVFPDTYFDTIQGFTTFDLRDEEGNKTAIYLPEGNFYVGWRSVSIQSENFVSIGLDKNTPEATEFIWFRAGTAGWTNLNPNTSSVKGAIMIRPIVGEGKVISTSYKTFSEGGIKAYPNPARDFIFLSTPNDQIQLLRMFDASGRQVLIQSFPGESINIGSLAPGLYFMQLQNSDKEYFIDKIVINR